MHDHTRQERSGDRRLSDALARRPRVVKPLAIATAAVLWSGIIVLAVRHPLPVLGGLLAVAGIIAIFRYPVLALGALLFVQPFNVAIFTAIKSHTGVGPGPLGYWKDAVILALFARAFFERLMKDRRLPIHNTGDNFVLFYVLAFTAIAVASPSRATVLPALGLYVEGPLLFLAIRWLRLNRNELRFLITAMLSAVLVIGAAALIEWFGPRLAFHRWYGFVPLPDGEPFVLPSGGYRAGSFITDPLILGFYLAAALPFATAVATIPTRWRWVPAAAAGSCAGGLIVTLTRSGYIGGAIGVLIALALTVRNPGIRLSIVGLVVVIAGSISIYYLASNNQNLVRSESNSSHRQHLSQDIELLVARPFGYGLGTTDRNRFRPNAGVGQLGAIESTFLARALESGVQGLVLYLVALYVLLMRLRSARLRARARGDGEHVALAAGAIGAIAALSLAGLFLGIQELVVEMLFWGIPGVALAWPTAKPGLELRSQPRTEAVTS
jgi:hypothetical protein